MQLQPTDRTPNAATHGAWVMPCFLRRERLRDELLASVEALECRRTDLLPDGFLADYLALRWLEMRDGEPRLTLAGHQICAVLRERRS